MSNKQVPEFLKQLLIEQYGIDVYQTILDGFYSQRFVTIRINTLKTNIEEVTKTLGTLKIEFEYVKGLPDALVLKNITSKEALELDLCQNGFIYLQSLSSQLAAYLLNPTIHTDILDMCAAPGSKTTYLAALTNNDAFITACEINQIRMNRLQYNVNKLGATKVNFLLIDAKKLDDYFRFDQILLDAPCSGSGTLNQNDDNMQKISLKLVENSAKVQTSLLRKALTILKPDSEMIYSTCSILSIENEMVIKQVIKDFNVEVVPINCDAFELPLLPTTIKGALCICPNTYYEGFFVVKLKKYR